MDRCLPRVQQQLHDHRGQASDPLYRARRLLRTGTDLLTDRQRDPSRGKAMMRQVTTATSSGAPKGNATAVRGVSDLYVTIMSMQNLTKMGHRELIAAGLDKALYMQQPQAQAHVARLRRVHPDMTPEELITYIDKRYLCTVTALGASAGAAAVFPNGVAQVSATTFDLVTSLEASVYYILCITEIHGLDLEDRERLRLVVTSVMLGEAASSKILDQVTGRTAPYWGKKLVEAIPMEAVRQANKILGPRFITKWGTKTGVLVLGKQVPLLIGAVIGSGGNALSGLFLVKAAKRSLGPPPASWPKSDRVDVSESQTLDDNNF